jgi:hypothetical protein
MEMHLDDKKIHIFGAWRTNVTDLNARDPRAGELALPKSIKSGNLGLKEFPRALARVDIVPRAKEGRVSGFDSGK